MAYTTTAQVREYLKIDSTDGDALIARLIAAAQRKIDTFTKTTFEVAAQTTRYFDAIRDVENRELMFDTDLVSITTLTNKADSAAASETWGASEYVLFPTNSSPKYKIVLRDSSEKDFDYVTSPEEAIAIAGSWGFSAAAPADITQITIRLVGYYFRQKDAGIYDVQVIPDAGIITVPQGLPRDVREDLFPYVYRGF